MCQGNGEVTAAHPFCVILQKDRLYFKGTDRAVFFDKREFTGPIYTQIKEAVDFVFSLYAIVCGGNGIKK